MSTGAPASDNSTAHGAAVVAGVEANDDATSAASRFGYRQELKRALTPFDLLVYGMVLMVPIAPFTIFGFVMQESKGMIALAYLFGMAGMLFTALSYAVMARAFPIAGSVYAYVQRGLHPTAGFLSGWLILLDYILIPSLLYLLSALALSSLLPQVDKRIWVVAFIACNALVNLRGIEFTAAANRIMLWFQLAVLALFVVVGLWVLYHGAGAGRLTWLPLFDAKSFNIATIAGATSIAVLSFLGFDGISTLAEENRGGSRSVGRATIWALVLVGGVFVLQTWIAADLARGMPKLDPDTGFYDVVGMSCGTWLKVLALVATAIANGVANAMAAQGAVARILYAMARDRQLPAVLAKVHPRFRTPFASILVVTAISLLVSLGFSERVEDLTRLVNFGALTSFFLLHIAVIYHHLVKERSRRWGAHLVCPLLGMAVIGYVLLEMDETAKNLGIWWIAAGVLYYVVLRFGFHRAVAPPPVT
jgi:amino acid transporter